MKLGPARSSKGPKRPSAVRAAHAEAVHSFLLSRSKNRTSLAGLYNGLIRGNLRCGWTKALIHRALDDLAAEGRVRLEGSGGLVFVVRLEVQAE